MPRTRRPSHLDRYSGAKKTLKADYVDYDEGDVEVLSHMPELALLDAANKVHLRLLADDVDKGKVDMKEFIAAAQKIAHSRSELTRAETERRAKMSELYTVHEMMEIMRAVMKIIQGTVTNKYEVAQIGRQIQSLVSGVSERAPSGEHGVYPSLNGGSEAEPSGFHGSDN